MAGVANDNADVVLGGEGQGRGDISRRGHIHRIADIVTQEAGLALGSEGVAALVGEECLHNRGRRHIASTPGQQENRRGGEGDERGGGRRDDAWGAARGQRGGRKALTVSEEAPSQLAASSRLRRCRSGRGKASRWERSG